MCRSAHFYVDCNSEAAILKPVNPNNLTQRRGITAIIGCVPQNHADAHSDVVVLCPCPEVKAVAGSVQRDLYFLLVFRIGGTSQQWPGDLDPPAGAMFLSRWSDDSRLGRWFFHDRAAPAPHLFTSYLPAVKASMVRTFLAAQTSIPNCVWSLRKGNDCGPYSAKTSCDVGTPLGMKMEGARFQRGSLQCEVVMNRRSGALVFDLCL
jgi:hypothetical protein